MTKLIALLSISLFFSACSIVKPVPDQPLVDRYWRAVEIAGNPVVVIDQRAQAHVVFDMHQHTHGSDGCNRFNGEYVTAQGLRFGHLAIWPVPEWPVPHRSMPWRMISTAPCRRRQTTGFPAGKWNCSMQKIAS